MTLDEAIKILQSAIKKPNTKDGYLGQALDMAIKALEQQPCDDVVSRILTRMWKCRGKHTTNIDKVAMEQIIRDELPPVIPQQKYGKWIKMPLIEAGQSYSHECSLCGRRILITDVGLSEFPYCHCGAKKQESE